MTHRQILLGTDVRVDDTLMIMSDIDAGRLLDRLVDAITTPLGRLPLMKR